MKIFRIILRSLSLIPITLYLLEYFIILKIKSKIRRKTVEAIPRSEIELRIKDCDERIKNIVLNMHEQETKISKIEEEIKINTYRVIGSGLTLSILYVLLKYIT